MSVQVYSLSESFWRSRGRSNISPTTGNPPDPGPGPGGGLEVPMWDIANPASGYAPWLVRETRPDPFLLGAQSGAITPEGSLTPVTLDELKSEVVANGTASGFKLTGDFNITGTEWWGAFLEDGWIDAAGGSASYGIRGWSRSSDVSSRPPDYDSWIHLRNVTVRGIAARPGYTAGMGQSNAVFYGGWAKLEAINGYGAKAGFQPIGPVHAWGCWVHGNHWESGDHNGVIQIRGGNHFQLIQDCRFEGFRDYGVAERQLSGACWQMGSMTAAIQFLMNDNCYFDGGQVGLRGADLAGDDGWASGAFDPEGYVKNNGWYVISNPLFGRGSNTPVASIGAETTSVGPRLWYDTREEL